MNVDARDCGYGEYRESSFGRKSDAHRISPRRTIVGTSIISVIISSGAVRFHSTV